MTDLEIHQALIAAVTGAKKLSKTDRATALDELNRHKVGCRQAPWRDCPVIVYYATTYKVDLSAVSARAMVG